MPGRVVCVDYMQVGRMFIGIHEKKDGRLIGRMKRGTIIDRLHWSERRVM
jgi:hypothetical protein